MKPRNKRPRGRPSHVPSPKDRQTAEVMAGFGIPLDNIALVIGIDRGTLAKHYGTELERGRSTVEAKLAGNLLRIASGSDNAAMKAIVFALQCKFGWRFTTDPSDPNVFNVGKKEAAQRAAETAGEATDWGDDLRPQRPN